jgi:hypothetical protein
MAFPRPHSCIQKLVNYFASSEDGSKALLQFWEGVVESYCFNENKLFEDDINKRAKIGLNNIGFYTFLHVLDTPNAPKVVSKLLTPNFVRMWVSKVNKRNKNKLESVVKLDEVFRTWVSQNSLNLKPKLLLNLIKLLFGPNANRRFTLKNNAALLASLAEHLSEEAVSSFISYATEMFKTPNCELFYPKEKESDESEEDEESKDDNKQDNIRIFALNLLVNTIPMFKNHSEGTLKELVNFIVLEAFFNEDLSEKLKEFAKDKLFALVDGLHKTKAKAELEESLGGSLGLAFTNTFCENKSLWINEVNKTIGRYALEGNIFNSLDQVGEKEKEDRSKMHKLKQEVHKEFMDFGTEIKKMRKKVFKRIEKVDEANKQKCRALFKKIAGLEILVFALALFAPVSPEETKEDLTEIQLSVEKIALEDEIEHARAGKTLKLSPEAQEEKNQAYQIFFDFLISLLTRQNSTLRDITNFTFKAFCHEMNDGSLNNIISILNTPNVEASKILVTGEEQPLEEMEEMEEDEQMDEEEESEIEGKPLSL